MANRVSVLPVCDVVFAGYHPNTSEAQINLRLRQCEQTLALMYLLPEIVYAGKSVGFPAVRRILSVADDQVAVYRKIKHDGFPSSTPTCIFDARQKCANLFKKKTVKMGKCCLLTDSHLCGFTHLYHASYRTAGQDLKTRVILPLNYWWARSWR